MIALLMTILGLSAANASATGVCGEYLLVGQPAKNGIYLFTGTANEAFVKIEGFDLVGPRDRLLAQYNVRVRVSKDFEGAPKVAKLVKSEGPAKSPRQVEQGHILLSAKRCD